MPTEPNEVHCPRCVEKAVLDSKLRYSPDELAANRGVCAKCAKDIRRHHSALRRGEQERPAEFRPRPHHTVAEHDVGFSDSGAELSVGFNFDEVDALLGEIEAAPASVRSQAAELVARLFVWVWEKRSPRTALVKFSAVACGLREDLVGGNQVQVAKEIGVTKQALSKAMVNAEKVFKLKFSRGRSDEARQHMREARLRNPVGRNVKPASDPHPGKESFA